MDWGLFYLDFSNWVARCMDESLVVLKRVDKQPFNWRKDMQATWEISCERFFPETKELTKNGTKKRMMIDVRKMRIKGDFIFTNMFEVNYLKRNKEFRFFVKQLVKPKKELWPTLVLQPLVKADKWEKEGNYTREQFTKWLGGLIGNAESAVIDLMTMPPQNVAA